MIKLKSVSKIYKMGDEVIKALDDINIEIEKGEFIAIIGPSGSGKTTLANIIGGLDKPKTGQILVDNIDLSKAKDGKLSDFRNKKIGFVFQNFNLQPNYSALENVMVPLIFSKISSAQRKEKALKALEEVSLADRAKHKPAQLSGGQRQRVCIARALVNNPSIIIADEPTGNLDSKKSDEIIELLIDLNKKQGITILVITHDNEIAKRTKRILRMLDGKVSDEVH